MELRCSLQTYEWGKIGEKSEAALLANASDSGYQIVKDTPYAELWMGTHPNGPSRIASSGESLHEWIIQNPQALGDQVLNVFGVQLPFLFKVLSVNKALSIQVHPSKAQAEELYIQFPNIYKDPNHKPEMAVALSPFEALCGFQPLDQIKMYFDRGPQKQLDCWIHNIQSFLGEVKRTDRAQETHPGTYRVPELRACVGQDNIDALKSCSEDCQQEALCQCFHSLMTTPDSEIQASLTSLLTRLSSLDESSRGMHLADLVERLHAQFPGDIGVFGPYLFNYVILRPGQAMYLPANEPHAYLSGDCIECMACSDNTVRAGLTPKLKDVPTLCRLLSYVCEPATSKLFTSSHEDQFTCVFRPPVPDFAISKICVPSQQTYSMIPRCSATISIVISGSASSQSLSLRRGSVFFLPANNSVTFTVTSAEPLLVFQAMANV